MMTIEYQEFCKRKDKLLEFTPVFIPEDLIKIIMDYEKEFSIEGTMIKLIEYKSERGTAILDGITNDGNYIYASAIANHRIVVFTREGKVKYCFGGYGNGDGQFNKPSSLIVYDSLLYVLDIENERIQIFTLFNERDNGCKIVRGFKCQHKCWGISIYQSQIFVTFVFQSKIGVYTLEGQLIKEIDQITQFKGKYMYGISVLYDNIYVTCADINIIICFSINGIYRFHWYCPDDHDKLTCPVGIASFSESVYISDEDSIRQFDLQGNLIKRWFYNNFNKGSLLTYASSFDRPNITFLGDNCLITGFNTNLIGFFK